MAILLAQAAGVGDYLNLLLGSLYLLFVAIAIPLGWRWQHRRAQSRLRQWEEHSGCHIVDRSYRLFRRGPFFWSSSNCQDVFRVVVTDVAGNQRSGWVCIGDW